MVTMATKQNTSIRAFHMLSKTQMKPAAMIVRMPVYRFSSSEGNKTIYVDGISTAHTEEEMRVLFKEHGEINNVNMLNYREDLSGKCFIEYTDSVMAEKAVEALKDGLEHNGATLKVTLAR